MSQTSLMDFVGVCIVLAALVFSPEVASIVAPYMVIILAAVLGASFKVGRNEARTRVGAIWLFLRSTAIAVLFTVGVTLTIVHFRPELNERYLLAPIALMIGWIDWPAFLRRTLRVFWSSVDNWRKDGVK